MELLEKVINKYQAHQYQNIEFIEVTVSADGLAFSLKQRPAFKGAKLIISTDKPYCSITPIGKDKKIAGVLENHNVFLTDINTTLQARKNAREYFGSLRRWLYWDDLDMAYFANYAFWNYYTFALLLINPKIKWTQIDEYILEAQFDESIPTHSKIQRFYFDEEYLLTRHDYSADVISRFATAANVVTEHQCADGLYIPSKRVVTPHMFGKVFSGPKLIEIQTHEIKFNYKST